MSEAKGSVFRRMQAARAGAEFYVGVDAVRGLAAVPETCAAVGAFFALEGGRAVFAEGDGLAGAHGDARLLIAADAEADVAEDDVIGEAGHGLNLAAKEQCVLMGDEQAAVEAESRASRAR